MSNLEDHLQALESNVSQEFRDADMESCMLCFLQLLYWLLCEKL